MASFSANSPLTSIPSDANILILGPPLTGKYELLLTILAHYSDHVIIISTKNQATQVVSNFRSVADTPRPEDIGVIDCTRTNQAIEDRNETQTIKFAESPENLTRIGVKFTELFEYFYGRSDGQTGVGLHSISPLIMHSNIQSVYQFLQVLTGQVRSAGWFGIAAMDAAVVDQQDELTIQHHFDGVVETRENEEGRRQFRVRGITPQASEWTSF